MPVAPSSSAPRHRPGRSLAPHRGCRLLLVLLALGALARPVELRAAPAERLPQRFRISFEHQGRRREAYVSLPRNRSKKPMGLVVNLHGIMNSAYIQERFSNMDAAANERGLIAVHPEGSRYGGFRSWDTAGIHVPTKDRAADSAFVKKLVEVLAERLPVDPRRVYATGFSNGAFLSYELARQHPSLFAAIAPVAGLDAADEAPHGRVVPVMHVHGRRDPAVLWRGNPVFGWPGAERSVERWLFRDQRPSAPARVKLAEGVTSLSWRDAAHAGELVTLEQGGHSWPGNHMPGWFAKLPIARLQTNFDATRYILDFFERHPLPASVTPALRPGDSEVSGIEITPVGKRSLGTDWLPGGKLLPGPLRRWVDHLF